MCIRTGRLGGDRRCLRVAKHVPAAPYGLDKVIAAFRMREFLAQLTDKDVDDFELGLVHSPVEVVQKHFLGNDGAFVTAKQLENPILLAGQVRRLIIDRDDACVEVNKQSARLDHHPECPLDRHTIA
jgi:hypothetical protein